MVKILFISEIGYNFLKESIYFRTNNEFFDDN